jgi:preprotein translocase subunit SecB
MSEENQQFAIQKVYLKDASFESPRAPQIFAGGELQPQLNIQINSNSSVVADSVYEVVLDITVTAKVEDATAFLVEVKQAGVFSIAGFPEAELGGMLGAFCPETLFPFAREAIADLSAKGGFPQLLIAPINFSAMYAEKLQQQQETAEQNAAH